MKCWFRYVDLLRGLSVLIVLTLLHSKKKKPTKAHSLSDWGELKILHAYVCIVSEHMAQGLNNTFGKCLKRKISALKWWQTFARTDFR